MDSQVNHSRFSVRLGPGCGTRLVIGRVISVRRYANQRGFALPWVCE
jgi:hypothetical protein